jgi:hypothetical protein
MLSIISRASASTLEDEDESVRATIGIIPVSIGQSLACLAFVSRLKMLRSTRSRLKLPAVIMNGWIAFLEESGPGSLNPAQSF